MQKTEYLKSLQSQIKDIERQVDIVSRLPEGVAVKSVFEAHKTAYVVVEDSFENVSKLLPPVGGKVRIQDGSVSVEPALEEIDWTQRFLPVWVSSGLVQWYAHLSEGELVRVQARGPLHPPQGYEFMTLHHGMALRRKLRTPELTQHSPSELFEDKWDHFLGEQGFNAKQCMFANVFKTASAYDRELTDAMLPQAASSTMEVAGQTLAVLSTSRPVEAYAPGSYLHGLARIGVFWESFTAAQAMCLVGFANQHRCALADLDYKWGQQMVQKAKQALGELSARYLQDKVANAPTNEALTYYVQHATGAPVTVAIRANHTSIRQPGVTSLWVQCAKAMDDMTLKVNPVYDPNGFDFNSPPFYEYEPNEGHF